MPQRVATQVAKWKTDFHFQQKRLEMFVSECVKLCIIWYKLSAKTGEIITIVTYLNKSIDNGKMSI